VLELTVVIPAYNAGVFIGDSIVKLQASLECHSIEHEIIIVDDGSTDGTSKIISCFKDNGVRSHRCVKNSGKGAAIKQGIVLAKGRYIVATDADIPYGTDSVICCLNALRAGAPVVIGDRTLPQSKVKGPINFVRWVLSALYLGLIKVLFRLRLMNDFQCGLKGFHSNVGKELVHKSVVNRFAFDLEAIVFAFDNGMVIKRVPVVFVGNWVSTLRVIIDPLIMFRDVIRIAWKRQMNHYRLGAEVRPCPQKECGP